MKKLLCKIGIHDWEVINYMYLGMKDYHDRVCLRCGKTDNSYTKIGRPLKLERKAQALNMWKETK